MIVHDVMSDLINYKKLKEFGLSEEYFFSLPRECQQAIIMAGLEASRDDKRKNNLRKERALKQYDFEKKVKVKVLSFFKKNK